MGSEAEGGGQAGDHTLRTSSDMEGADLVSQDGAQFEDALRRLNALESKLAGQVLEDISELRKKWVQARVDRVSNNTYKLYQVRKSLKQSKMLYVEEDQLLEEFARVKAALLANSMDDDTFDAAKETCLVLGGKLSDVRSRQLICYSDSRDLETEINQNIMKLTFDKKDFNTLDLKEVRSNTPLRELSPTPLDKHSPRVQVQRPLTLQDAATEADLGHHHTRRLPGSGPSRLLLSARQQPVNIRPAGDQAGHGQLQGRHGGQADGGRESASKTRPAFTAARFPGPASQVCQR